MCGSPVYTVVREQKNVVVYTNISFSSLFPQPSVKCLYILQQLQNCCHAPSRDSANCCSGGFLSRIEVPRCSAGID